MGIRPTKSDCFRRLKAFVDISAVVDVGVREGTHDLVAAYPSVTHYLFDPMLDDFQSQIQVLYGNVRYEEFCVALNDRSAEYFLIKRAHKRDGILSHSVMRDAPEAVDGEYVLSSTKKWSQRFDEIELANRLADNFLLKIDVDGPELAVISGFGKEINRAAIIVVECTTANMCQRISALQRVGFTLIDLVDQIFYGSALYQMDAVFVRRDLVTVAIKPDIRQFHSHLWMSRQ